MEKIYLIKTLFEIAALLILYWISCGNDQKITFLKKEMEYMEKDIKTLNDLVFPEYTISNSDFIFDTTILPGHERKDVCEICGTNLKTGIKEPSFKEKMKNEEKRLLKVAKKRKTRSDKGVKRK